MTKRAFIVIAVLMIIPVVFIMFKYRDWKEANQTVAEYGESVDEVKYGRTLLKKVEGSDDYLFRQGEYLGKIGDIYFGSQLYTLKDGEDGDYYVMAGNEGLVLLNESGKMIDGIQGPDSVVTRVIIGNYLGCTEYNDEIGLFLADSSFDKNFKFTPGEYADGEYSEFEVSYCYDGSAVATGKGGRFIYLTESNKWVWISEKAYEAGNYDLEQGTVTELTFSGKLVGSPALMRLLGRYALGKIADESSTTAAD